MRKLFPGLGIAFFGLGFLNLVPVTAQEEFREVNITQGSEPGWVPSERLEAEAVSVWNEFYRKVFQRDYESAYDMLSEGLRADWPYERFRLDQEEALAQHGSATVFEPLEITWTKGSSSAPTTGTYVALDTNASFEKAEKFCGYTVLQKLPDTDEFDVARIEQVFLTLASEASMAEASSPLAPELVWNILSRGCPNYSPSELPNSVNEGTGYDSVAEARIRVESLKHVDTTVANGWTVLSDRNSTTIWSFAPEGSPYYPALIKRAFFEASERESRVEMTMLCEATKRSCDALYAEMAARNGMLPISLN